MRGGKEQTSDNERLEFIGDRVLGLVIAEALSERFPSASEGELARRYNRLVRGEACARVARSIGLGSNLILSDSEAGSGGRAKGTILATRWRRSSVPSSSTPASRRRAPSS